MQIKQKGNGKETRGYGKKSVTVDNDPLGKKLIERFNKALNAASPFGKGMFK